MMLGVAAQWATFGLFALIAVLGALGMATTMSMFRSGIFLMASFIGVAGLFILLSADLIGLLQVMMYIGGMLVMILFMLLFSMDPGGAMMAGMQMAPIERLFSLGLQPKEEQKGHDQEKGAGGDHGGMTHDMHGDGQDHNKMDHQKHDDSKQDDPDMDHAGMDMGGMNMDDMSMVTPARPWAAALGISVGAALVFLLLWRPAWPISAALPDPDSARQVGTLLMGKYMIAFEGAGLLILLGIFGAVMIQRPGAHPSPEDRAAFVSADENPAPIQPEREEVGA